ncbi:hypothetical protein HGRIS_003353 [Hohenbuehelia grisea]|uniref:Actin-related protein 10 n=1 Tax=Hohenbuehelia grisea TaxID=104357 RepID=A0ABR3JFX9_9AGAR
MQTPTTPQRPSHASGSNAPKTPATSRVATTHVLQASPAYSTTRRHSVYGTEDRVVIDPGSRIWKVGFSGEGKPRDVFYAGGEAGAPLWGLRRATNPAQQMEEDKLLEVQLERCLRSVFHNSLLTDPKSRKVIIVEHPFLPLHIKDAIARILFENLQAPSISFASSHLLSLFTTGRITGLVLDCGHHESTALPIFASRPLFSHLRTTPLAGSRLTSHLRALLLLFGTYLPPPTTLSAGANIPAASRATRVPEEILTDSVIEEIKTRCCFVGGVMETAEDARAASPTEEGMDVDVPPPSSDATQSESDFSHLSAASSQAQSSEFSVVSSPHMSRKQPNRNEGHLQSLADMYKRQSTATDLRLRVVPPVHQQTGTGRGTLVIPGWIRERAAEVLFEGGDVDESSVAEVILDTLLKVPVDLRKIMASSILIAGGTAMMPGFISRLHAELVRTIDPTHAASSSQHAGRPDRPAPPPYDKYAPLRPLARYFAILNNPAPLPPQSERAKTNAGSAPAFAPATLAWVGGSLAGALKTGGIEVPREKWDEGEAQGDPDESMDILTTPEGPRTVLPDWTRSPLPTGAPHAVRPKEASVGA